VYGKCASTIVEHRDDLDAGHQHEFITNGEMTSEILAVPITTRPTWRRNAYRSDASPRRSACAILAVDDEVRGSVSRSGEVWEQIEISRHVQMIGSQEMLHRFRVTGERRLGKSQSSGRTTNLRLSLSPKSHI
jgi:hypothetical protein